MTLPSLLLIGAGGHAHACIDVIEQSGQFVVGGILGLPEEVGTTVLGYSVVGSDADLARLAPGFDAALVTVGQIKTHIVRMRLFAAIEAAGCVAPTIVSPRAYVSRHARIGGGTIVMHDAVVNAGATVGRNCILNTQSLLEHDVVIGDHCHVATRAAINGGVRVGNGVFIGSGATVRQGTAIGDACVIGMGQRILTDCAPGSQVPPRSAS